MNWFKNQYDIFVVDYKVIIKDNLTYKRAFVGIFSVCLLVVEFAILFLVADIPIIWVTISILALAAIIGWLFIRLKSNGVIEIDNENQIVRYHEKYTLKRPDIIGIKISSERGSAGYIYDYLSLITRETNGQSVYHILRVSINDKKGETETERIAKLIADTLQMKLVIEPKKN